MITNYKDKKVSQYLAEGAKKVLIRFGHGLGDTIMFYPALEELRRLFPSSQIDLYVECGQEEIFESIANKDAEGYDHVFHLDFPMSEGSNVIKMHKCCKDELGIEPPTREFADLSHIATDYTNSPLVAVHFQGTALPGSVSCPEETAKKIWFEILAAGKVPIECHFRHVFHNPVNVQYPFVDNTIREWKPSIPRLIWLLANCSAFVGVASGPFVVGMALKPDRVLYLERHHKLINYTTRQVPRVDINDYKEGEVQQWIESLS